MAQRQSMAAGINNGIINGINGEIEKKSMA